MGDDYTIQVLNVKPGDILVFHSSKTLPADARQYIAEQIRERTGCKSILVLQPGDRLSVLTNEDQRADEELRIMESKM